MGNYFDEVKYPMFNYTYKNEEIKFTTYLYQHDIKDRAEYPEQNCCESSVKVGEWSHVWGIFFARGGNIFECPTCNRTDFIARRVS